MTASGRFSGFGRWGVGGVSLFVVIVGALLLSFGGPSFGEPHLDERELADRLETARSRAREAERSLHRGNYGDAELHLVGVQASLDEIASRLAESGS